MGRAHGEREREGYHELRVELMRLFSTIIQTSLEYIFKAVTLRNNEAIEAKFQGCIEKALGEEAVYFLYAVVSLLILSVCREISSIH